MGKSSYSRIAAALANEGVQSAYFDRLRARVDPEQNLRELEQEIAGEIARALGRSEELVLLALAECDLLLARHRLRVQRGADESELAAARSAFNEARTQAERRLRELVIHREAAGFRRNQQLYELYRIPPRL